MLLVIIDQVFWDQMCCASVHVLPTSRHFYLIQLSSTQDLFGERLQIPQFLAS